MPWSMMANFEAFRWNFLSSTNSEIGRSDTLAYTIYIVLEGTKKNQNPLEKRKKSLSQISYVIIMQKIHTSLSICIC